MTDENSVLHEAIEITKGDRNRDYGHPLDNLENTAEFWSGYIMRRFGVRVKLNYRDVSMMMVLMKVSRDANRPKRDNLVDICGYTNIVEKAEKELGRRAVFESKSRAADVDLSDFYYLAGPMRGYPRFNFDAFEEATQTLRQTGLKIASPHEHDLEMGLDPNKPLEDQPHFNVVDAFYWDLDAVKQTRGTIFLPGWEKSEGARTEAKAAFFCGKELLVYDPDPQKYRVVRKMTKREEDSILHRPKNLVEDNTPKNLVKEDPIEHSTPYPHRRID
jgi:hypothetical protein